MTNLPTFGGVNRRSAIYWGRGKDALSRLDFFHNWGADYMHIYSQLHEKLVFKNA